MKLFKKTLAMLLALVMVLNLAACGAAKPAETVAATEASTEAPTEAATEAPIEAAPVELAFTGIEGSGIPGTAEELAPNVAFGVDLSFYNVNDTDYRDYITNDDSGADYALVDFEKMKADGCDFVILRLGSEDASGRFFDPHFITYYNKAREAGLDVGLYYYTYSLTYEDAVADAEYVISVIEENNMYFDYPIFMDLEEDAQLNLPMAELSNICIGWAETLQNAGYFPAIYSSFFMYDNISANVKANLDFWIAYISTEGAQAGCRSKYNPDNTNISNEACMWQYDWHAGDEYDGIGLPDLDVNVSYKDYPAIMAQYGYNNVESE